MIVAFPLAELFSRPTSSLSFPTESGPPPPIYSIPEARVKRGESGRDSRVSEDFR